ncbi:MAG: ATP-binding protein [Bacteroidales bacterium]|nr:ATP-binding protein [Bacteroidales bacterium]
MMKLVGRKNEIKELERCLNTPKSEFVVVYGRRRIGKTFLIRNFFNEKYDFSFVGRHNYPKETQLAAFAEAIKEYGNSSFDLKLNSWEEAFKQLRILLENKKVKRKKVIFIDEMPWLDNRRSDFVPALESFWNAWAALRDDIMLVACGSSTSWIVDKILKNKGGLFNRVTMQIYLRPFSLSEVKEYLENQNCSWDNFQIAQAYMVFGGVPFYYSLSNRELSLAQNIDRLFFSSKNAVLRTEFNELFAALFSNYDKHIEVIKILTSRTEGLTRTEISEKAGFGGSEMTKILDNLERCDFIMSSNKTGGGVKNKIFRICDFYTLFYYKFVEKNSSADADFWQKMINSPKINTWQGFCFELLCLLHITQIKRALGIDGVLVTLSTWRSKDRNAQIDLVIERSDRIVNLCEIKFSVNEFVITKDYESKLRSRAGLFAAETGTKYALNTTFITTYGISNPQNHSIVNGNIVLDDLF